MKNVKSLVPALALMVGLGLGTAQAWAKDGILNSIKVGDSNYCHMHFPAMVEGTLSSDRPVLKDTASGDGDIIHFYGPCDYDPHGKEAVQAQKRDESRRWQREYNSD